MSKVSISGDVNGTGNFTIKAPATNTDRVFNLPDEAGTVLTNVSDIESQVKTATNATGSAPVYACRAWVQFDPVGTVSIIGSGNVSSITDESVGRYFVNFSTAMPDANYAALMSKRNAVSNDDTDGLVESPESTRYKILTVEQNTVTDAFKVFSAVFR